MQVILTQSGGFLKPVYYLLGMLMNGIFTLLEKIGIPNIGLAIIVFTLVIYLCLMPLTIKQQKFSKLSAKMNPELQAIQKKYKDKKDNESMMRMNEETKALYAKYGVSQTGTCLQMLIQLPIMWCLYRIIYNMPAYVPSIKAVFSGLVTKLSALSGSSEFLQTFKNASYFTKQFKSEEFIAGSEVMKNTFIDVLNKASTSEWMSLKDKFPDLSNDIMMAYEKLSTYNNFFGLNIANAPSFTVKQSLETHNYVLLIAALMVPILSALTQLINYKLMPQQPQDPKAEPNPMMQSMKTMNYTMPIFSAFMCYGLPAGMGIYWITGSVIRSIQQIVINRHIDKIDIDEMVKKNVKKLEEKEKIASKSNKALSASGSPSTLSSKAHKNTKSISYDSSNYVPPVVEEQPVETKKNKKSKEPVGSIAAKANKVKQFNENNN